jgi:anaerobic magnesium-protoporphyrin IX monomethyl ester cyclase
LKIILSHSYFLYLDPKEAASRKPYPPLATLVLAALIKQEIGLDVTIYDVMFDHNEKSLIQHINTNKPDIVIIYDDDFNYLTKMCLENMRNAIFRAVDNVKTDCTFIAHGSDASDQAELYLKNGFRYVVHANAENIILRMVKLLLNRDVKKISDLSSLTYSKNGKVCQNPVARDNFSREDLPDPAWQLIDLTPYRKMWTENHGYFSLNISTAHGCPYHCNWCAKPLYGRTYKAIPATKIARQFEFLKKELSADHVWITDDIFALKPGWITEFADDVINRDAIIPYKIQLRSDLVNQQFTEELARSGCTEVWLGVESGSQKILDAMEKNLNVEQIYTSTKILKSGNIKVGFFIQYGYPGEEFEDIKMTLRLIRECKPDFIGISVSYPLKDTPFYKMVINDMGEKLNWTDSGDLALMFPGKYHPDFYRALHSYTHHYFGILSLFKKQPLIKLLRRIAAQYKHIPGILKYRRRMNTYLTESDSDRGLEIRDQKHLNITKV